MRDMLCLFQAGGTPKTKAPAEEVDMNELYKRCADALGVDVAYFEAWIDGDIFAGWNIQDFPGTLEELLERDIISEDEYSELSQ